MVRWLSRLSGWLLAPGRSRRGDDAGELKRVEAALRESEARYDLAMLATNEGLYEWNVAEGTIFYSDNVFRVLGAPRSIRTPQDWRERVHPDDRARYDAAIVAHFKGETGRFACDYRYRAADDSWRWARQQGIAVRDESGRVVRMIGATGDITALKLAEIDLRDQIELTRALIDENPNAMYLKDTAGRYVQVNDAWLQMVGLTRERALGRTVLELFPEKESERYHAEDMRLLARGEGASEMESLRTGPGERPQWVIIRKAVLRRADGTVIGLIGTNTDITELKRIEAELADRVKFIGELVDVMPISVAMRDLEGRYLLVNRTWEKYFGVRREDALGKRRRDFAGEGGERRAVADEIERVDRETLANGPDYVPEPEEVTRLGRSYLMTRRAFFDSSGKPVGVVSAGFDTTERRVMERRLDLVVNAAKAGIVDWDGHSHVTYYSPRFREILGHAPDADTSQWPDYFKVLLHPDDRERFTRRWQAFIKGRRGEFLGPDQHRLLRKDGSYVWVEASGVAVRDDKGFVTRWIAATTDITERRAHEEALQETVRLREEVERMSRHDLKTPLNSVIAVSRLLREGAKFSPEDEELLSIIERAGYRILSMVNLSLDLYRMEAGTYQFRPQAIDLADIARKVAADLEGQAASKNVAIKLRQSGSALARAEELLCYSMLANLVKNAIEATPEFGVVSLQVETAGDRVSAHVHNPTAVPEAVRGRFFDKYASSGKSAGLGLGTYSARLMARVQEGELTMQTGDVDGTTLTVLLTAARPHDAKSEAHAPAAATGTRAERLPELPPLRVLVVDDDEFNRLVLRRMLPSPPLGLAMAVNGRAALDAARSDWPDVALLDLEMPVMDGYEAAAELRKLEREGRKPLTIVAISSNDDPAIVERAIAAGCDYYLVKPAPRETLWRLLAGEAVPQRPEGRAPSADAGPAPRRLEINPRLRDTLPGFLDSRRKLLREAAAAAKAREREKLRSLAHKAAGSFALYGFHWATAKLRSVERDAHEGGLKALAARLAEVRKHIDDVEIEYSEKEEAKR